jgi:hypothetical protein|tara:strand:- start:696 stop:890 length:195 start_codon:yes stop_codon:yes gene_type:complete
MANFRTVNRRIVTHGLSIKVVRGDGYIYFDGAEIPSIYVHPVTTPTETVIRLVQAEIDNIKGED